MRGYNTDTEYLLNNEYFDDWNMFILSSELLIYFSSPYLV